MTRWTQIAGRGLLLAVGALALAATPLAIDGWTPEVPAAQAKGQGGGGGGHGGGNGHDKDGENHSGKGQGHARHGAGAFGDEDAPGSQGAEASARGSLNKLHSPTHAAEYTDSLFDGELAEAAASLADMANKSILEPVVHSINSLLGIDEETVEVSADNLTASAPDDVDDDGINVHETESTVAEIARALQEDDGGANASPGTE